MQAGSLIETVALLQAGIFRSAIYNWNDRNETITAM